MMIALRRDLRSALRGARNNPGLTAVMLLSLGLAIGATTATFSLVNTVLLRPLPLRDSSRLVMMWTSNTLNGAREQYTSLPNVDDWRTRSRSFEDLAVYREFDGPLILDNERAPTEWVEYTLAATNLFSMFGRGPALGRVFTAEETEQGSHVAVISHRLWQRSFGGAADVLGKRLDVGGLGCEVIGVMPGDFWFPSKRTDLWLPASLTARWRNGQHDRATRFGPVLARLKPEATVEHARAEMNVIADQLRREYPATNAELGVNLVPLHEQITGTSVPSMLTLLFGAVIFVLLIACANMANLQLARGLSRRREIAMRVAMGAERRHIVRQLLTESVCLSLVAGGAGLALAAAIVRAIIAFAPAGIVRVDELGVDLNVGLFAVALSVATGVGFGLVPALRFSGDDGQTALRATGRVVTSEPSVRALRSWLVAGEFALAIVLLTGAGLLIRSLLAVRAVDAGFGDRSAVTAHVRFHNTFTRARRVALYREAIDRLSALPGVRAVGGVSTMFWGGDAASFGLRAVEGRPVEAREQWTPLTWTTISGRYFQALRVPLLAGRYFSDQDRADSPPVVIVNETMARRFWPNDDPIGKRIKGFDPRGKDDEWITVVGVVSDVRSRGVEQSPMAQIFEAQAQSLDETESLVVSTAAPAGIAGAIRDTVAAMDRTAVISDIATLERVLGDQSSERQFETSVLGAFGALALVLAAAGIFGVMHYSVSQRTPELGIRMALGAQRQQVIAMIVREGLWPASIGMMGGVVGSLGLTQLMSNMLFGVTPQDPLTLGAVSLLLVTLAILGSLAPAIRAARVDPLEAVRGD